MDDKDLCVYLQTPPFDSVYFFAIGAIVLVGGHQDVAVCHLVDAAIAGRHHIVDERRCHMPMGGVS